MATRVPAIGPKDAKIFVLGESPGMEEVMAHPPQPFVGDSGKEQDKVWKAVGLKRKDLRISNVYKYQPPRKGKEHFFFSPDGSPSKALMDGIIEVLEEIREVKPNVVVPVGDIALWALTQQSGILNWRGSILESTLVKGQKVIPVIHPAWFIHGKMWNKWPFVEWDWQRIKEESRSPEINLPKRELVINPTNEQILDAIERFKSAKILATDTEWYNPDSLAYISFSDSPDFSITIPPDSMLAYRAYNAILDTDVPKIMHNAVFDSVALDRIGIRVRNVVHDTMIGWWACWGDLEWNKLHHVTSVLTKEPYYKEDLEFVQSGDDRGQEYAAKDSATTFEAAINLLDSEFDIAGGRRGYEITTSVMPTFIRASKMGIRCDRAKLEELREFYLNRADDNQRQLNEILGFTFNPRSPPQTASVVYDELGFGKQYTTRSTAKEKLMDIAGAAPEGDPKTVLTKIIRVREDRNIVSRYLTPESHVDRDGRIRTNWRLNGTRNGRFSTNDPWWPGLPLQTVPNDAREIFIPDPGHIFIGWDYEQAEARYVAIKTRDWDLLDAMKEGKDIHIMLASMLPFNLSYDEIVAMVAKAIAEGKSKDDVVQRYLAKQCRHALNYYATWVALKKRVNEDYLNTGVGIDAALAKALVSAYLELHPGLEAWWEEVYQVLINIKYMYNSFGRRRNFLGKFYKGEHIHRDAIAFQPQSSIADLNTLAIADMDRELDYGERGQIFAHMHDGGLLQVREEDRDWAVDMVRRCATKEMVVDTEVLVIPVEVKEGENWKDLRKVS